MKNSLEKDATPCVAGQRKKRFPGRWSIRQLIYSSPLLNRRRNQGNGSTPKPSRSHEKEADIRSGNSSRDVECGLPHPVEIHQAASRTSVFTGSTKSADVPPASLECPLCFAELGPEEFFEVASCGHRACLQCMKQYLRVEISESRVIITCHECPEPIHPNEIKFILDDPAMMDKYEDFMVRRVLAVEPDTRWCPAPDCGFAVIASECASCPKLRCERPGCDSFFCYHCKAEWHPNQTCDAARAQRSPNVVRSSSIAYSTDSQYKEDIKPCPRCEVLIVKMDDGSCNHMMCAVCGAEFCWLCMKEISDLHYLSPSGCTFWGKKPWSRKKKILWQLGTLVGAPVGIALVAGITVPAMIIGIPVWIGRKIYTRYQTANKHKRNAAIVGGVLAAVVISPILAGLAVGIGVPILLFYVYGVVPVSLCRSGGCGGGSTTDDNDVIDCNRIDRNSIDAVSVNTKINPSIGEASLSLASDSHVLREADRESASTVALAGSMAGHRLEVQADLNSTQRYSITSLSAESGNASFDETGASMRALAGSIFNYKGNGSDSCSYNTNEDGASERVRFDDNVSYKASQAEKVSIGSSCSYLSKSKNVLRHDRLHDTVSNDSIYIDITPTEENPARKFVSQTAFLRSQFFHSSINEQKPITKSMEERTIIEVSNETLDKPSCSGSLNSLNSKSTHETTEL
ncbi:E3 ubiquitin-protein ligase RNF19A-like isoform X1 [Harmonia axyridis]|uniref:E3 ubiquitin-protein ligase RNF19A-like isoform X1 n=1 Tax=Harmonia axyridis TaxID=115357 RepID=UPI001E275AE3|nr:E3 ubiquitin-protein ligase RNF19A-like isoform X1 [Harmonia axyridis]XP_045465660.1 E3 ubiquitin-protein ligase RNF19A-like isoform X1 [Harmonia axyridis]